MTLENQVTSLELSKKLRELGVKQESLHSWCYIEAHQDYELDNGDCSRMYSAFTVAELGEMLPGRVKTVRNLSAEWFCEDQLGNGRTSANTEADARAKILIHLIENKLITL